MSSQRARRASGCLRAFRHRGEEGGGATGAGKGGATPRPLHKSCASAVSLPAMTIPGLVKICGLKTPRDARCGGSRRARTWSGWCISRRAQRANVRHRPRRGARRAGARSAPASSPSSSRARATSSSPTLRRARASRPVPAPRQGDARARCRDPRAFRNARDEGDRDRRGRADLAGVPALRRGLRPAPVRRQAPRSADALPAERARLRLAASSPRLTRDAPPCCQEGLTCATVGAAITLTRECARSTSPRGWSSARGNQGPHRHRGLSTAAARAAWRLQDEGTSTP